MWLAPFGLARSPTRGRTRRTRNFAAWWRTSGESCRCRPVPWRSDLLPTQATSCATAAGGSRRPRTRRHPNARPSWSRRTCKRSASETRQPCSSQGARGDALGLHGSARQASWSRSCSWPRSACARGCVDMGRQATERPQPQSALRARRRARLRRPSQGATSPHSSWAMRQRSGRQFFPCRHPRRERPHRPRSLRVLRGEPRNPEGQRTRS